jgi:DNA-binding beta-propeller fold protein YncE
MRRSLLIGTLLLLCSPLLAAGYHLMRTLPLAGDKGWDYAIADSAGRRLYVTHGDRVMVVDLDSDTLVGQVAPLQGIHGVALNPALGRGYISDGKAGAVVVFDLKTLAIIKSIKAKPGVDAIAFEPASGQVVAFSGEAGAAVFIDAAKGEVAGTLDLGGKPEFCAVDGKGTVYVNLEDKAELLAIDAQARKVLSRSSLAPGQEPSSLSMDVEGGTLFVGCHNRMALLMDAASGKMKASLPIGAKVDASAYDPGTGMVFHSCGDGTLWAAVKGEKGNFSPLAPVHTQPGSRTMALDLKTHLLFLPAADFEPLPLSATAKDEHSRPKMIPGSFKLLVFGKD